MAEVVVRLDRTELVQYAADLKHGMDWLREEMGRHKDSEGVQHHGSLVLARMERLSDKLRAALDSPPVEEEQWRVTGKARYTGNSLILGGCPLGSEDAARRVIKQRRTSLYTDMRVQSRSITTFSDGSELTSPWTDLPSEEGERG